MILADLRPTTAYLMGANEISDFADDLSIQMDFKLPLFLPPCIGVVTEDKRHIKKEAGVAAPGPTPDCPALNDNDVGARVEPGKAMGGGKSRPSGADNAIVAVNIAA